MSMVKLAGGLALSGVVAFAAGLSMINPLVQRQEAVDPIGYISERRTRVRVSAGLTVLGLILSSVAFPLWRSSLQSQQHLALSKAGSALLMLGVVFWAIYAFLRVERPVEYPFFAFTWQGFLSALATIGGLGIYGLIFVLSPAPNWLGYFFILSSVAMSVALILRVLPPIVYYLPILIAAFVFLFS